MSDSKIATVAKRQTCPGTRQNYSALTKSQAILSIWAEKRKPREICRELGIHWALLRKWENRALDGMLTALSPMPLATDMPALSKRVERLLTRRVKTLPGALQTRLARRLESITAPARGETTDKTEKASEKPAEKAKTAR